MKNVIRKRMSSQLYNKVEANIKIINDKDESHLIRSLLREELESIRNLLNKEHNLSILIGNLQKRELSDNGEK